MSAPPVAPDDRAPLRDLPLLRFLSEEGRDAVVAAFEPVTYRFGQVLVREGDAADALYVIAQGRARVVKAGEGGAEVPLNRLGPGDLFGEAALLGGGTRSATVRASGDVQAWRLDAAAFAALVAARPELGQWLELQARHRELHNFFLQFTAFRVLPPDALARLLEGLEPVRVRAGEVVVRAGDPPGAMYIVQEGQLRAFVEEDGRRRYLAFLRRGDWFGELSVFKDQPRAATVEAYRDGVLLALTREAFRRLLDECPPFAAAIAQRVAQYDYRATARVPLDFAEELLPADAQALEAPERRAQSVSREMAAAGLVDAATPDAPFRDAGGRFVRRRHRIRRVPFVRQIDAMDCGAACLAMVCRHFGREVSLARIRELAHTSVDGTSLRALVRAAEALGLAARAVRTDVATLERLPVPAIVHWEGNHWVVLHHTDATHAWIADPALGPRRVPLEEFARRWTGFAALFDLTEAFAGAPEGARSGRWLLPFIRPFAGLLGRALGLAFVVSALQMCLPVFSQVIVDKVLVEKDTGLLVALVLGMAAVLAAAIGTALVQRYLLAWVAVRVDTAALDFLTRTLLALPLRYFAARRTGDIQRRLAGMQQVREFVVGNAVVGLSAAVQFAVALLLMALYSGTLALVFLATVPLYGLLLWFSRARLRPMFASLEEASGRYQSHQVDAIRGIETVKAMGAEGALRELMLREFTRIARRRFRASFLLMSYDAAVQALGFLATALFLWVGALQVLDQRLTVGAFVAFSALVALANGPLLTLVGLWDGFQWIAVLLDRLNDVLEPEPEQGRDRSRLLPVRSLEGRVQLRNVGFRYGGPESPPILDDISLDVPPNATIAIVGRSGSGKTTLVKLLAGLLEPTAGQVLFDGRDLTTLDYRDLRRQVGFVLQENHLFSDTIARNIAFGEDEPDLDAVIWAARAAAAHDFIARLPLGYDTPIGESGLALSGGQRQRIAIARALYRRPPILILDEATSALDTESERAVKESLDQLLGGRTTFVIAHRLSTVRDADRILVLEQGRVAELGTHEELMENQGLYFYLCSQQLGQ
ncbi:MAG: peptidase domain-containing ABC transporter [Gemmatimonadales bacterium]|nr:peptidase domain-containing ABC transporter [Gemmatimonadales bacterium]